MSAAQPEAIAEVIDILVEAPAWRTALPDIEDAVREAALCALNEADPKHNGALSVLLADDAAMRVLNRQFRGADKPTNVLAFPAPRISGHGRLYGDIALGFETVAREAKEQDKSLRHHVQHLVVHGVLHLLGLDHENDRQAEEMEALETRLLQGLGISDPYRMQLKGD